MKKIKTKDSNLLTINEVAEYLKLNKNTIYFMAKNGTVPALKIGKQWRIHKDHLDAWMQGHIDTKNNQRTNNQKKEA